MASTVPQGSVFAEAASLEAAHRAFVLCVVVDTHRSAPRDGGARMLVRDDGSIVGTIGGGPLEATVIVEAGLLLQDRGRRTHLLSAELTATSADGLGMKCGGSVRVLLDAHRPGARVHVFGAGHVGLGIVQAGLVAGWGLRLLDDRADRLALAPPGVPVMRFPIDDLSAAVAAIGPDDFVVIVTRCHEVDERVLGAVLRTQARYIGLIGSKAKVAQIFRNLRKSGGIDPSADERVFAPIGLAIGGKEPGEIALSVWAELLAVRDGAPLEHRRLGRRGPVGDRRGADDPGEVGG